MRAVVLLLLMPFGPALRAGEWVQLPPLPDTQGVAGAFAGVSGGALLVAGGANFPDKPPWEGGQKVWYDRVLVLERPDGRWTDAGRLPRPLAYGVSVTHGDGVVCVGGSDRERHHADAFRLTWDGRTLVTTPLPSYPGPIANACGAILGDVLYVAGGQAEPDALETSHAVHSLDLSAPDGAWRPVEASPSPGRMLAVAGAFDGAFWLIGGVDLVNADDRVVRRYLRDAYRYDPGRGWRRVADLPHPVAAAPSPIPTGRGGFLILGGDDGSQVGVSPPDRHTGFNRTILRFDPQAGSWVVAGELPAARVTVPLVRWGDRWVIPSGEARPGVRSPEVWSRATGILE